MEAELILIETIEREKVSENTFIREYGISGEKLFNENKQKAKYYQDTVNKELKSVGFEVCKDGDYLYLFRVGR